MFLQGVPSWVIQSMIHSLAHTTNPLTHFTRCLPVAGSAASHRRRHARDELHLPRSLGILRSHNLRSARQVCHARIHCHRTAPEGEIFELLRSGEQWPDRRELCLDSSKLHHRQGPAHPQRSLAGPLQGGSQIRDAGRRGSNMQQQLDRAGQLQQHVLKLWPDSRATAENGGAEMRVHLPLLL